MFSSVYHVGNKGGWNWGCFGFASNAIRIMSGVVVFLISGMHAEWREGGRGSNTRLNPQ